MRVIDLFMTDREAVEGICLCGGPAWRGDAGTGAEPKWSGGAEYIDRKVSRDRQMHTPIAPGRGGTRPGTLVFNSRVDRLFRGLLRFFKG